MAGIDALTVDNLETAEAVLSLGLVVVKQLETSGVVTLFINEAGQVEICPRGELEMDALPQDEALSRLLDRGYEDSHLLAYLKGRKAREARNG